MIEDTLNGAKHKRYRCAAKHLAECAASDAAIADYANFPRHERFLWALQEQHSRKHGFWRLVGEYCRLADTELQVPLVQHKSESPCSSLNTAVAALKHTFVDLLVC